MDEKFSDRMRAALLAQMDAIARELEEHDGFASEVGSLNHGDLIDQASALTTGDTDQQIVEDNGNLMRKIRLALQRLDDGTYETCVNCGQAIPRDRLIAKPSVSLCVPCQEASEEIQRRASAAGA